MKIRIKLNLCVLNEYFIATLCEKKNVGEGLFKRSEMVVKMKDCLASFHIERISILISVCGMLFHS